MPFPRSNRFRLFVGALAVRLLYVLLIARQPVGVGGDASFYHSAANLIAEGHFYYRKVFGQAYPTALHPPLFSLVLSPVALLGGVHLFPQRLVGCLLGAINVVLIAELASRLMPHPPRKVNPRTARRAFWVAGVVACVYPPLVTADGSLQSEPLYVLLVLAALLLAQRTRLSPTSVGALGLGALLGLGTLTRTEALLLLALLGLPAVWPGRSGRALRVIALGLGCLAVLAPWVVRNAVVFHKLELASNYDTVIPAGNCHGTYYGHDLGWWSFRCLQKAQSRHQVLIGEATPDAGFRYIARHPGRAVLVAGVRVLRMLSLYQPLRIGRAEPRRRWVDLLGLVLLYPLLLLAPVGLLRARGWRWLLAAPLLTSVIAAATGWGNARFRIGADGALVVLGALAISLSWDPAGAERRPRSWLARLRLSPPPHEA